MSEVNGVSEQIKILFNEKTQDIKELLDCVKKCIEIIKELKRENEYLKTMNDGLEQQKEELINILKSIAKMKENDENELSRITKEIIDILEKYK